MAPDEREPVLSLLHNVFGLRDLFTRYMDHDPEFQPRDLLLAVDGGRPVACVQIFSKRIRLRRQDVALGGIGSVATLANRRGEGLATALLEHAIEDMQRRGMAISLLFTGNALIPFYERLGWVQISLRQFILRPVEASPGIPTRALRPDDLPRVREIYDHYTAGLGGCTLRDERYWSGQLRYAGAPDESFRVALRDEKVVAYARVSQLFGASVALEYARARSGAAELAELLLEAASEHGELVVPLVPDAELGHALKRRGAHPGPSENSSGLWRVLDRPQLLELAGMPESAGDATLLNVLVGAPSTVYWMSDRF